MARRASVLRRMALIGAFLGVASFAASPAGLAAGPVRAPAGGGWTGGWHGQGGQGGWHATPGGWQGGSRPANAWRGGFSPFPHAPSGTGFGVRNPYPHVQNFSFGRTTRLPGGQSASGDRTFSRTGYGDYTYDRSVTGPGGRTATTDLSQTFNPANGSYTRTMTASGFNGKTTTGTTDFSRSSRGNDAYSYTDVGPDGKAYTQTMDQTFNPANHDLTRTGSTTLGNGKTANYTTTVNNAGTGIYDYSSNWSGFNGGSGSATGTSSR